VESTINGRSAAATAERSMLDAYAQDGSTMRGFVRDHAKGAVPN
jgi:hypothetical protein